ncbi:SIMPL domain-containing protein [Euryhalocaulis caribicus]|uniref:SIMPL domain-containing protein n=1 Tax=Euryhalocaulis caribicus TaxID=1161401 RepID=UPI00039BF1DD|nr:SIMPL domain-containing protein [Euryhalocaulis caribicus]
MIRSALVALTLLAVPASAMAQNVDLRPKLSLNATGEAKAAPDMATLSAGVVSQAQTAEAALSENSSKMNRVVAELRKAGVADKDIQTSNLNISPVYANNRENTETGPRISGYRASNQVTATVRDLDDVGPAIDAMVRAGANNVNNVGFSRENSDEEMDAARRDAMEKILEKARLYAEAGGFKLGPILELSESGGYYPQPQYARMAMAESADGATPVEPGELTMSVNVNATFQIEY